jgi:hypothetical protein
MLRCIAVAEAPRASRSAAAGGARGPLRVAALAAQRLAAVPRRRQAALGGAQASARAARERSGPA